MKNDIVVFLCIGFLMGFAWTPFTYYQGKNKIKQQAIEHGYAEHNSQTGEWQWKERVNP